MSIIVSPTYQLVQSHHPYPLHLHSLQKMIVSLEKEKNSCYTFHQVQVMINRSKERMMQAIENGQLPKRNELTV